MSYERRKIRIGRVVSHKMDKTVVVSVEWSQPHRIYKKNVKRWNKFMVHDENNSCNLGDTVQIIETRPQNDTDIYEIKSCGQFRRKSYKLHRSAGGVRKKICLVR